MRNTGLDEQYISVPYELNIVKTHKLDPVLKGSIIFVTDNIHFGFSYKFMPKSETSFQIKKQMSPFSVLEKIQEGNRNADLQETRGDAPRGLRSALLR